MVHQTFKQLHIPSKTPVDGKSHSVKLLSKDMVGLIQGTRSDGVHEQENAAEVASTIAAIEPIAARPDTEVQSLHHPLQRPLQVPTRRSTVHSGFQITTTLESAGVTETQWKVFTGEIRKMASLSFKQWVTVDISAVVIFLVAPLLVCPIGPLIGYKMYKHQNLKNFSDAQSSGLAKECTDRWNLEYFEPQGLHVVVCTPNTRPHAWAGSRDAKDMDIATTRFFKPYQKQKVIHSQKSRSEFLKVVRKVRIVVWPLDLVPPEARLRSTLQTSGILEDSVLSANE